MPRIPIIKPESELDAEQKRVLEGLLGRRGGRIPGPYRFTLHAPAVTEYMHPFGELLRLRSTFPLRLSELAIIVTARMWDCDYVFHSHSPNGVKNGLPQSVVDALARGSQIESRASVLPPAQIAARGRCGVPVPGRWLSGRWRQESRRRARR